MSVIVTVMMFDFRLSRDNKKSNNFLLHSFEIEHLCSVELFDKKKCFDIMISMLEIIHRTVFSNLSL
jgi:hypothetical protein